VTATDIKNFQRYLVDRTNDGQLTVRGPFGSDAGTSRIVGNKICDRFRSFGYRESCGFVFRVGAVGSDKGNDHLWVNDRGIFALSPRTESGNQIPSHAHLAHMRQHCACAVSSARSGVSPVAAL
jgi:hypothetical protein